MINCRWRGVAVFVAAAAFTGSGCQWLTASQFPSAAVPFAPHGQYEFWWQLTESCSGLAGSFADVKWYQIPDVDTYNYAGVDSADGSWWIDGDRIVLAGNALDDGRLVRHEMLHALLRRAGHPAEYFQDKCGGFVTCSSSCMADRPPPITPAQAAVIVPKQLTLEAQVLPSVFSNGENGGWIAVVVAARNPFDFPVWVSLAGFDGAARTFGASFASGIGSTEIVYDDKMGFAATQTRSAVIDIRIDGGGALNPRDYSIFAFFNADTAAALTLTVK